MATFLEVDCKSPGADIHGHAWMVEREAKWNAREGTGSATTPKQPPLTSDDSPTHCQKKDLHQLHMHVVLEGKQKLVNWFGKSMFVDMHVNKSLPALTTPRMILEHLKGTHAKPCHHRQHVAEVQKAFKTTFDSKKLAEVHCV